MRTLRLVLVVLSALMVAGPARAERPVTYREALSGAMEANPTLGRAQVERDQAEASVLSARGIFDPQFSADASYSIAQDTSFFIVDVTESESTALSMSSGVSGSLATGTAYQLTGAYSQSHDTRTSSSEQASAFLNSDSRSWRPRGGVSLTQQLLKGAWMSWNLQNVTTARQALDVSEASVERTRQETLANAATAYWQWVYTHELHRISQTAVEVAEEAQRIGKLKLEAGELAPVEQTRIEAATVQARVNALDAGQLARQAADALLLLMGRPPGEDIVPATSPGEVPEMQLDAEAVAAAALAGNLDLLITRKQLEAVKLDRAHARHGRLPSLAATASAGVGSPRTEQPVTNPDTGAITTRTQTGSSLDASVGGTFSVPLGNRVARGEAQRTALSVQATELQLAELERTIRSQVEQQVLQLQTAKQRVELADANQRLAEQTLSAEEALAEAGRSIQKDVLEARTEVDRTRAEAAKARTDYRLAQVELLRLQGKLEQP